MLENNILIHLGFEDKAEAHKKEEPVADIDRKQAHGGSGGIRTHVPLRTTAFRVRLVMTTSIRFHSFLKKYNIKPIAKLAYI